MLIEALLAGSSLVNVMTADVNARLNEGVRLVHEAKYTQAETVLRSVLQDIGGSDARRGPALNNLGAALYYSGKTQEVEKFYLEALAAFGKNAPVETAAIKSNLATLYRRTGRFEEAETLYVDVLHYREATQGKGLAVAPVLSNLAELYLSMGRYAEAESYAKRSVDIHGRGRPTYRVPWSDSLQTLASARRAMGAQDEAEALTEQALQIRESSLGPDSPRVAASLSVLGGIRIAQQHYAEAEQVLRRALDIFRGTMGTEHPDIAATMNNLAQVCKFTGRNSEAEQLYRQALEIWARTLGDQSVDYALGLGNLADLFRVEGRLYAAGDLYRRAIAVLKPRLGTTHPFVVSFSSGLDEVTYANVLQRVETVSFRELTQH
jgi:tetratricopeptide (TPR) repeat protein